jgi:hypothetical protein
VVSVVKAKHLGNGSNWQIGFHQQSCHMISAHPTNLLENRAAESLSEVLFQSPPRQTRRVRHLINGDARSRVIPHKLECAPYVRFVGRHEIG